MTITRCDAPLPKFEVYAPWITCALEAGHPGVHTWYEEHGSEDRRSLHWSDREGELVKWARESWGVDIRP